MVSTGYCLLDRNDDGVDRLLLDRNDYGVDRQIKPCCLTGKMMMSTEPNLAT